MKIGLALGSGAARGWAHIGIIQALEELGVQIDVVAGCSIGAYVGAAYTSGKLEPLAEWASSLTEWQVLGLMGVGIHKGGLASGHKVFKALEDQFCESEFEDLAKPLAVVATDLYSGKEVAFQSGSIRSAVRASCAIPALFPPSHYNGRWLVDGAVVNPVPVNLCRQMGADFVFAVNLSADFRPQIAQDTTKDHEKNEQKTNAFFSKSQAVMQQWFGGAKKSDEEFDPEHTELESSDAERPIDNSIEEVPAELNDSSQELGNGDQIEEVENPEDVKPMSPAPSIIGVMSSSLEILQARVTRSRLAGDPPDVLIEPQLRDFGSMEFHRAAELIEEGYQSVARVADQIKYQLRID
jgi:NTE family protein